MLYGSLICLINPLLLFNMSVASLMQVEIKDQIKKPTVKNGMYSARFCLNKRLKIVPMARINTHMLMVIHQGPKTERL